VLAELLLATLLATTAPPQIVGGTPPAIDGAAARPSAGEAAAQPTIEAVYPDPATVEDRGEFVVVSVPNETTGDLSLSDGEDVVRLSNVPTGESVAVAADPGPATALLDCPVHTVEEFLSLSNAGEWVTLRVDGRPVSNVTYPGSSEGELFRDEGFVPPGRTSFPPMRTRNASVRTFLLPDDPRPIESTLRSADRRIFLAGYTLTDPDVTDALLAADRRDVAVRVLVDGAPVGGIERSQVKPLDRLRAAGIRVTVLGGDHARYRYHHAKYAVVDDRAIVLSENWEPGSAGGNGSRGWGAVVAEEAVAQDLARIFRADTGYVDAVPWNRSRPETSQAGHAATADFPRRFPAHEARADAVTLIAAPDNAKGAVLDALASAEASIRIQQVSIETDGALLEAAIRAAERGVSVRILLAGTWYVESENRALAERLRKRARRDDLPLRVRLAEPRSRYDHVHAKGLIVDGERTLIGSLNWNPTATTENREVAVMIDDPDTAAYFRRAFRADWRGAAWRISWWTVLVAGVVVLASAGAAHRMATFESVRGSRSC
jgi:phosphatidylserine/phosphatidylglycerophosphate/cardiolipin synthase-like enzyme